MKQLKGRIKDIEEQRQSIDAELRELLLLVPQIPHPEAPRGVGLIPIASIQMLT